MASRQVKDWPYLSGDTHSELSPVIPSRNPSTRQSGVAKTFAPPKPPSSPAITTQMCPPSDSRRDATVQTACLMLDQAPFCANIRETSRR